MKLCDWLVAEYNHPHPTPEMSNHQNIGM